MNRVVTVHLSGMSLNLDEDAYDALRAHLRTAESQLAGDPRRTEILAEMERSIAEKCEALLKAHEIAISAAEMRGVLAQLGGVEGQGDARSASSAQSTAGPSARPLVQVREGAMVSGVCNGLAARFGIDVTLVRVILILLALATSGAFVLLYFALMFLIPYDTDIEKINDQSLPGFMFKFVTHTKRKLAGG